jgi:hypothetical protein
MEFQSLQNKQNNRTFSYKNTARARSARTGPKQRGSGLDPARSAARWQRLNLPARPGCQRPRATESVSADSVRSIRTEIDGGEPSSPSHRGLDETLALATGESGARLTEGRRGWLGWLQGGGGLSEVSSASKACRRRCSRWCVVVLVRVVLGFHQRWRCPRAAREETRCRVRFRSSRGRVGCRERAEGDGRCRPKPSPSTPASATFLELSCPGNGWGLSVGCSGWRGEGLGKEWRPGEGFGRSSGFYTPAMDSVLRGFDRHGLGSGAVLSGWCSELRGWVGSVRSGV